MRRIKEILIVFMLMFITIITNAQDISYNVSRENNRYFLNITLNNENFDSILIFAKKHGKYQIIGEIHKLKNEVPMFYTIPLKI